MAAFVWNTDNDGLWEVATNWLNQDTMTPGVPGAGDSVTIDRPTANPTVTVNSAGQAAQSLRVADRLVIVGGSLQVNAATQIDAGGVVELAGDVTIVGSGSINLLGTLRKSAGIGQSNISKDLHVSGGTFDVQSGVLAFASEGLRDGGVFAVSPGASIDLTGGTSFGTWKGTWTGTGGGRVELNSGTLDTASEGATFNLPAGMFHWTGGSIFGPNLGFTSAGHLTIEGASNKSIAGRVSNSGTIVHSGEGDVLLDGSSILTNHAGALYDLAGDADIGRSGFGAGFTSYVLNSGTLRKSAGTDTSDLAIQVQSSAGAVFDAQSGRLKFGEESQLRSTAFTAATGAAIEIAAGAAMEGTITGSGAGRLELTGGTFGSWTFDVPGGFATFNFPENFAFWSGGGIASGGSNSVTGNGTTLVNAGFLTIEGPGGKGIGGTGLINTGTIVNTGSGELAISGVTFDNRAGAVYEHRGDAPLGGTDQFNNPGRFINAGTFKKTAGVGTVSWNIRLENAATGTIDIDSGRMRFIRGGTSSGGAFEVDAGAALELAGGDTFNLAGTFTGMGPGTVEVNAPINGHDGNNPARFDFPSGVLHMLGGQLLGSIVNVGIFDFAPAAGLFARAGITNQGTWIHSGAGDLVLNANSRFINEGLYLLQTDADLVVPGDASGGTMFFVNRPTGILRKSGALGTSSFRHDGTGKELRFDNTGTVEVQTGTIEFLDPVVQFASGTLTAGQWIVRPFTTLSAPNAANLTTNRGRVTLDGPSSVFTKLDTINSNQGTFKLAGGRDFTTLGNLTNSGEVAAGPGSVLTVTGNLTQSAANSLVGWWRGEGNASDSADATPLNGTLSGDTTFAAGAFGQAFSFDGDGDLVSLGNPPELRMQEFTISAWVKRDNLAKGGLVFSYGQSGYGLGMFPDGKLFLTQIGISHVQTSSLALTDTNFHHVAVTKSGNTVTFYIDGVAEVTGPYVANFSFGQNVAIGSRTDAPSQADAFQGRLDEIAVFNRPLAATEIQALQTSNNPLAANLPPTLTVEIADRPGTGQFGQINATGAANLGGRLNVKTAAGFAPPAGDVYQVMGYASKNSDFAEVTGVANLYTPTVTSTAVLLNSIATPPVDLVVDSVTFLPTSGQSGDSVTVSYTARNAAAAPGFGSWTDSIYLSRDITYSPDDVLFARVAHAGGVGPSGTYMENVTAPLPGLIDGDYHFIVIANSRGDVAESDRSNNVGVSTDRVDLATPVLPLNGSVSGTIVSGQDLYFRVDVPAGGDVVLSAELTGLKQAEMFVSFRALPTRSKFDFFSNDPAELLRSITLASPQPGPYYILLHGREGAATPQPFELRAERIALGLSSISPARGSNAGAVTSTLEGAGFSPDTVIELVNGAGAVLSTAAVTVADTNKLFATFDLTGVAPGTYDVRATDGLKMALLDDGFVVTTGNAGRVDLTLASPRYMRAGRQGTLTVEYSNPGDTDVPAPAIMISSDNARFRLPDSTLFLDSRVELLGINRNGPAGVLPPGGRGTITLTFEQIVTGSHVFSNFEARLVHEDHAMDWSDLRDDLRPANQPADSWAVVYDNFMAAVGGTFQSYWNVLRENATYLSQFGVYSVDPARYLAFEMQQADNFGAITTRYRLGAFGRGMPDEFNVAAVTNPDGHVSIMVDGRMRPFFKNANGSYTAALPGDSGKLTRDGLGVYRIAETSGLVSVFHPNGQLNFLEDAIGNRTTMHYSGSRVSGYTKGNQTYTFGYNGAGRISQITDPVGRSTTYSYDASGEHLLSISGPSGTTRFTYVTGQGAAREHAIASIESPDGTHVFYEYDAQGRLIRQTLDGDAQPIEFSYDSLGNMTSTDENGATVRTFNTEGGQTGKIEDPLGHTTRSVFDAKGQLSHVLQPGGLRQSVSYDAAGNPTVLVDPLGNATRFTYDPGTSRPIVVQDARGNRTSLAYDVEGNLIRITDQAGNEQSYTYDAQGNRTGVDYASGKSADFTLNPDGQLARQQLSDGSEVLYGYDGHRNLTSITDASGVTSFTYDTADRMTRVDYPGGRWIEYTYDSAGRRATVESQDGFAVGYEYDALGRLWKVKDGSGASLAEYTYDSLGRLSRTTYGNGARADNTYDAAGRVASIVHRRADSSVLAEFSYTYDELGRRDSMTTAEGLTKYEYDAKGQLTAVELPTGRRIAYEYDAVGNRIRVVDAGAPTNYSANNIDQYTSVGGTTFTYDQDGNLATKTDASGTTSYSYDVRNRLIGIVTPTDTWAYEYDALGHRSAVVHNGVRTEYLVDPTGLGNVLGEYDQAGDPLAHYANGLGLVGRVDSLGDAGFYHFDAVGSTAALSGAGGSVLNSYSYLPYGEKLAASESTPNPFTFVGEAGVMDSGDGLYYMRRRLYDPATGRFTQRDPLRYLGGSVNLYEYAGNSPTQATDPSGLEFVFNGMSGAALEIYREGLQRIAAESTNWAARLSAQLELNQIEAAAARQLAQEAAAAEAVASGGTGIAGEGAATTAAETAVETTATTGAETAAATTTAEATATGATEVAVTEAAANPTVSETLANRVIQRRAAEQAFASRLLVRGLGALGLAYTAGDVGFAINRRYNSENPTGTPVNVQEVFTPTYNETVRDPCVQRLIRDFTRLNGFPPNEDQVAFFIETCADVIRLSQTEALVSNDPNDIITPAGAGPDGFLRPGETLPYQIIFENKPDASAPAQVVVITQQLDSDLDWNTFELTSFGFGTTVVAIPPGLNFYHTQVVLPATPEIGGDELIVDFTAGIDLASGLVTWTFTSLDPTTGDLPANPLAGFLPPNMTPPIGDGFVGYTIRSQAGLPTPTKLDAQARIVFDTNAPIDTPARYNTIDAGEPESQVNPLPTSTPGTDIAVTWGGTDDASGPTGSGIVQYHVYVSDNGGPFAVWQEGVTATSGTFTGQIGHSYAFYSIATDAVGRSEQPPATADATTTLVAATLGDFGDAPISYGTRSKDDGALHLPGSALRLGANRDGEDNGRPSDLADGDDLDGTPDDEDGVVLPQLLIARLAASAKVTASAAGKLDAWIDFNHNGSFDAQEQIADSLVLAAGENSVSFAVPAWASAGQTYARFRFSTDGNLEPTGVAADGEVEDYAIQIVTVPNRSAQILPDPENPGQFVWVIVGTEGADRLSVAKPVRDFLRVKRSNAMLGGAHLSQFDRLVVLGLGGNDNIDVYSGINKPAALYGDGGNDRLRGGAAGDRLYGGTGNDSLYGRSGNDWLFGESGRDTLYGDLGADILLGGNDNDRVYGGRGRDLLLGGLGRDDLSGQDDDDLLVAGSTSHDSNPAALLSVLSEWTSSRSYADRIANLRNGSGPILDDSGVSLEMGESVHDDFARDSLSGGAGLDWYFATLGHDTLRRQNGEING